MSKPSEEIAIIIEQIIKNKNIEKIKLDTQSLYVIIQAIISYLDLNAYLAEEKRKAFKITGKKPDKIHG